MRDKFLHGRPRMLTRDLFAVANLLVVNTAAYSVHKFTTLSVLQE